MVDSDESTDGEDVAVGRSIFGVGTTPVGTANFGPHDERNARIMVIKSRFRNVFKNTSGKEQYEFSGIKSKMNHILSNRNKQ